MARRGGTVALIGLPAGDFPTPIFDVVLKAISITGSIVGTRADLQEALDFAAEGLVKATIHTEKLENINQVLDQLRKGQIEGRGRAADVTPPQAAADGVGGRSCLWLMRNGAAQ